MFDVFNTLPAAGSWFIDPVDDMVYLPVCSQSGCAGRFCPRLDTLWVPEAGERAKACPWHRPVRLDSTKRFRINDRCYPPFAGKEDTFFVIPPLEESYYRKKTLLRLLPDWLPGCEVQQDEAMSIVYPKYGSKIYVPLEISGKPGRVVLEAAHRDPQATIFWHL
ncbi:MAG: hypothetical protein R3B47_16455 [Bacteroidia bacterium]